MASACNSASAALERLVNLFLNFSLSDAYHPFIVAVLIALWWSEDLDFK
jgi:hypothetical protein